MLKVVIGLGAVLVFCIVLVILLGYLLPVRHVASRSIIIRRNPEEVFALISNPQDAKSWRIGLQKVDLLEPREGRTRFAEVTEDGTITYEVAEVKPPVRMVTRISDSKLPFGGSWIYEVSPVPGGCRLNITERGEIYNPVFRFASRIFLGHNRSLDKYLESVSRKFGDTAAPADGVAADESAN
jgi:hypothetical protein